MNTNRPALLGLLAALGLAAHAGAAEITVSTRDGKGADASVVHSQPQTNYGPAKIVAVKAIEYARKKTYLRFDLDAVGGRTIKEAALVLTTAMHHSAQQTVNVSGLHDGDDGETWIEGSGGQADRAEQGLTWANAPANRPSGSGLDETRTVLLGSFVSKRGTGLSGDPFTFRSAALVEFLNKDRNKRVTLILTAANPKDSEDAAFASKENGQFAAPVLRLVVED